MLRISGKLILSKYNTMESITSDYDGKARQAAHLVNRRQQTVAKGLTASCGEAYEHVTPAYQIQYHFLLLGTNLRTAHLMSKLRKHSLQFHHCIRELSGTTRVWDVTLCNN